MLFDSAVRVAFTESTVSERRERVVKCRERTLRKIAQTMPTEEKLIGVEDQWLEEQSSMLGARERDALFSLFSPDSQASAAPGFLERSALWSIPGP